MRTNFQAPNRTSIKRNEAKEGEPIELKIERILTNKEPIKDGAPLIYTERKDGVQAGYNIKTDRFEVAIEAMDVVSRSITAKRDNKAEMQVVKDENIGGAKPFTGTEPVQ